MIDIKNVSKYIDNQCVIKDVNMTVNNGDIQVIYGENGVGKTTLIKCVAGLLSYNSGIIKIDDRENIGLVAGGIMLINKLTPYEYLSFICNLKKIGKKNATVEINRLLTVLNVEKDKNKLIYKLSQGNKAKVSLIAAIIYKPKTLLLDEPFSGMDLTGVQNSIELIKNLALNGSSIIISTHQVQILENFVSKIAILKGEKIILNKTMDQFKMLIKEQKIDSLYEFLKKVI